MQTINLRKIIADNDLDSSVIAKHLFPTHKHARLALGRVVKGIGKLDSDQISRLSLLTGLTVEQMYGGDVKIESDGYLLSFQSEDFTAKLNTKTYSTKLFDKHSIFHTKVQHDLKNISFSEYLEKLDFIIKNKIDNG